MIYCMCTKNVILDGASRITAYPGRFSYPGRVVISSRITAYPGRSVQDNILDASRIILHFVRFGTTL